jgi:FKBP-type peptidyl-prolyl cis-trans isomerase
MTRFPVRDAAGRFVIAASILAVGLASGCGGDRADDGRLAQSNLAELLVQDLKVGSGDAAAPGRTVRVHYTGWLYHPGNTDHKGREFDSSRTRNEPFQFTLGAGEVIRGWDQGVAGMKPGGTRRLTIPPALAYGTRGAGDVIPPNATLVFDIELLDVR